MILWRFLIHFNCLDHRHSEKSKGGNIYHADAEQTLVFNLSVLLSAWGVSGGEPMGVVHLIHFFIWALHCQTLTQRRETLIHMGRCRGQQWGKWKRRRDQARHPSPELSSMRSPQLPDLLSTPSPCLRSCQSCSTPPQFGCMGCTF